ncbi:MAG: ATP-binding protein [Bacteroidales bacterium]|nr:ATP-binding protein [Bacteroidales bacterium]
MPIQISVYNDKIIFWNEGQLPENWTIESLLTKHPSKPYNPDIANALFRSGYIESWGRGTLKMIKECIDAGLPQPLYYYNMSGFFVEFRKDIFSEKYLKSLGLNDRQEKAIIFIKERSKISNSEYQELNNVSKATATRDLSELVEKYEILRRAGDIGAGTNYVLIGS